MMFAEHYSTRGFDVLFQNLSVGEIEDLLAEQRFVDFRESIRLR
jgi:hypothetical protein